MRDFLKTSARKAADEAAAAVQRRARRKEQKKAGGSRRHRHRHSSSSSGESGSDSDSAGSSPNGQRGSDSGDHGSDDNSNTPPEKRRERRNRRRRRKQKKQQEQQQQQLQLQLQQMQQLQRQQAQQLLPQHNTVAPSADVGVGAGGFLPHALPSSRAALAGSVAALQQHPAVQQQLQALTTVDDEVVKQKVKDHNARVQAELQVGGWGVLLFCAEDAQLSSAYACGRAGGRASVRRNVRACHHGKYPCPAVPTRAVSGGARNISEHISSRLSVTTY